MPSGRASRALLATPRRNAQRGVRQRRTAADTLKSALRRRGCDPPSAPRVAAPAPSPSAADYHSCLPGVASASPRSRRRRQRRRGLARAGGECESLRRLFCGAGGGASGRQHERCGAAGAARVGRRRRRRRHRRHRQAGRAYACSSSLPRCARATAGGFTAVYRVRARVGPFECTTYRRFSAFLELQFSLIGRAARVGAPSALAPAAHERLQIQPHKHTEGRIRLLQKYVDELCAVPEASESAGLAAFFWPRRATARSSRPTGRRARCSRYSRILS